MLNCYVLSIIYVCTSELAITTGLRPFSKALHEFRPVAYVTG